jgi:trimeric autotransporter adhesin
MVRSVTLGRLAALLLAALLLSPDAPAQYLPVPPLEDFPSAEDTAARANQEEGFTVTNADGAALFTVQPNYQVRMGDPASTQVIVEGGNAFGLMASREAAISSAVVGFIRNAANPAFGLRGITLGRGAGVLGEARSEEGGLGVWGHSIAGIAVYGGSPSGVAVQGETNGTHAGFFASNTDRPHAAVAAVYRGTGDGAALLAHRYSTDPGGTIALFASGNPGSDDHRLVTGIQADGNIWTRGSIHADGTITSGGADFAERFAVVGEVEAYEPGDVLQISREADRHLERAAEPYSRRIAGVYATKPGVLLGDLAPEASVPLGVVGVVPTKVTAEGGPIRRGDLLVTSSTPGHAMKGDPERIGVGMVIGRALQDFEGEGAGLIEVLVNVQ